MPGTGLVYVLWWYRAACGLSVKRLQCSDLKLQGINVVLK